MVDYRELRLKVPEIQSEPFHILVRDDISCGELKSEIQKHFGARLPSGELNLWQDGSFSSLHDDTAITTLRLRRMLNYSKDKPANRPTGRSFDMEDLKQMHIQEHEIKALSLQDPENGTIYNINYNIVLIGRATGSEADNMPKIELQADNAISRQHALLITNINTREYYLVPWTKDSFVYLNDNRESLKKNIAIRIENGDRILLGNNLLALDFVDKS